MLSRLVSRALRHHGRKFTLRLEPEFWTALEQIAARRGITLSEVVAPANVPMQKHASAVRIYALQFFQAALADLGGSIDDARSS